VTREELTKEVQLLSLAGLRGGCDDKRVENGWKDGSVEGDINEFIEFGEAFQSLSSGFLSMSCQAAVVSASPFF